MGSHSLLQGILPTQGLNPGLLHYRHILYHLSHQGSPQFRNQSCSVSESNCRAQEDPVPPSGLLESIIPLFFGVIWKGPLITRPCSIPTRSSAQPNTLAISALPNGMVLLQSQAHKCSSVQLKAEREFSVLQSLFAFPFKWN